MSDPTLWTYDTTGRAILPDWAKAAIDAEMAEEAPGGPCEPLKTDRRGNIGTLELPSRFDPRRTYSWPLYESQIAAILERQATIADPAKAYRYVFTAASAASGCKPMVTTR